jgi:hypothetical protein
VQEKLEVSLSEAINLGSDIMSPLQHLRYKLFVQKSKNSFSPERKHPASMRFPNDNKYLTGDDMIPGK